jgi:hypothetical protein
MASGIFPILSSFLFIFIFLLSFPQQHCLRLGKEEGSKN